MKKHLPLLITSNTWAKLLLGLTLLSVSCKDEIFKTIEKPIFNNNPAEDRDINNVIISYNIYNDRLYPYRSFEPKPGSEFDADLWAKEKTVKDKHQQLFNLFVEIIPPEFRKEIKYLNIFDLQGEKPRSYATMGLQRKNSLGPFSLGIAFDLKDRINLTLSPEESEKTRSATLSPFMFT